MRPTRTPLQKLCGGAVYNTVFLPPALYTPTVEELVKRNVPWQQGGVVGSLGRRWRSSVDISFRPQRAFDLDLVSRKTLPRLHVTELGMWGDPMP